MIKLQRTPFILLTAGSLLFLAVACYTQIPTVSQNEVLTQIEETKMVTVAQTVEHTPLPTHTPVPATDTSTPTNIPTATSTAPPTSTPTFTSTASTPTSTSTPAASATDTPTLIPTNTPLPQPTSAPTLESQSGYVYPPIPAGNGLVYVINFYGDEVTFIFQGREEQYTIPGKSVAPDGGVLELFLSPGHYEWFAEIGYLGLKGAGELQILEGQIHGLGLSAGKIGPKDVIEGFLIGSDPLAPPAAPTPIPIPTPPTPAPGKAVLVLDPGGVAGEFLIQNRKYMVDGQQKLFIELEPGFHDIVYIFEASSMWPNSENESSYNLPNLTEFTFKVELPANSICELRTRNDKGVNIELHGYNCQSIVP